MNIIKRGYYNLHFGDKGKGNFCLISPFHHFELCDPFGPDNKRLIRNQTEQSFFAPFICSTFNVKYQKFHKFPLRFREKNSKVCNFEIDI